MKIPCSFLRKDMEPPPYREGIPLEAAMICVDCEVIMDKLARHRCPHCGSAATLPVARWVPKFRLCERIVDPARRRT